MQASQQGPWIPNTFPNHCSWIKWNGMEKACLFSMETKSAEHRLCENKSVKFDSWLDSSALWLRKY